MKPLRLRPRAEADLVERTQHYASAGGRQVGERFFASVGSGIGAELAPGRLGAHAAAACATKVTESGMTPSSEFGCRRRRYSPPVSADSTRGRSAALVFVVFAAVLAVSTFAKAGVVSAVLSVLLVGLAFIITRSWRGRGSPR